MALSPSNYSILSKEEPAPSSFSPDGEWLAYNWDPTGQAEVYVTPFPSDGTKYRVAQNAFWSSWSNDGSELFFMSGGRLSSVDVRTAPGFSFRGLRSFDTPLPTVAQMYYPMPSGERFAVVFFASRGRCHSTAHYGRARLV